MSKKIEDAKASRRDFLKLASASVPAAAAAVVVSADAAQAVGMAETGDGMQDTAQTRAYYESARF